MCSVFNAYTFCACISVLCRMVLLPSTVRLEVDMTQRWSCCWREERLYLLGPRCVSYSIHVCLDKDRGQKHIFLMFHISWVLHLQFVLLFS